MLAVALANCIMTIMGIKALDNGIDLVELKLRLSKDLRRVAEVIIEFTFPKKEYSIEEKQLIESVTGLARYL
jgi:hypothetical protein